MASSPPPAPPRPRHDRRSRHTTESSSFFTILKWVGASILLLIVAVVVWRWKGQEAYAEWRDQRMLDRAEAALASGNLADAAVAAKRLLADKRENLRALRIMSTIADQLGMRDAIQWRAETAKVDPTKVEPLLELALTAVRFGENAVAADALARVPADQRNTVLYHELSGYLAFGMRQWAAAEKHFAAALALDPKSETRQFNLAKAQMLSSDTKVVTSARQFLVSVPETSTNYPSACSLLAAELTTQGKLAQAIPLSAKAAAHPASPVNVKLEYLDLLRMAKSPELTNTIHRYREAMLTHPGDLTALFTWLNAKGYAPATLAWVRSQPAEKFSNSSVSMAVAELYVSVRDWLGLRGWVRGADWDKYQAMRFAYEARAVQNLARDENTDGVVSGLWAKGLEAAGTDETTVALMSQFAAGAKMTPQLEQTLWVQADIPSVADNAIMALDRLYRQSENTLGQFKVAQRMLDRNRSNIGAKNNVVWLAMLLQVATPEHYRMAQELQAAAAGNPGILTTVAFALHRQNRTAEGLKLLNDLSPSELDKPDIALTYSYLLAKSGDRQAARAYLKKAEKARLLPEEYKLLEEARETVR